MAGGTEAAPVPYGELDAVFFDIGGTLVGIDYPRMSALLAAEGVQVSTEAVARAEAAARPVLSAHFLAGNREADFFPFFMRMIVEQLPLDRDPRPLAETLTDAFRPEKGGSDAFWRHRLPHADECLSALRDMDVTIAAVSNSDGSAHRSLERAGLRHHFSHVIDSHVVGHEKPDPRIFAPALEAGGVTAHRTLYVGDIYAGDVRAARGAGLHAALIDPHGDYGEVDCPTYATLMEIPEAIAAARGA